MHTCSVRLNLLGMPRPRIRRTTAWKVFPTAEEVLPCALIAAAIFLGLVLVFLRISGV
jgi:hypothetical protein